MSDKVEFKDIPLMTFRRYAYCECGGLISSFGRGYTTGHESNWEHQCTCCLKKYSLDRSYPCLIYKTAEDG